MKLKRLGQLYLDGKVILKNAPVAANPCLNPRDAFMLKHGVYPYEGELPPWDEALGDMDDT